MFDSYQNEDPAGDLVACILDDVAAHDEAILFLRIYLDKGDKANQTDSIVTVAAAVFRPNIYPLFTAQWNEMLARWGVPAFHATDFYTGYPPFQRDTPERKAWFEHDCRQIPIMLGRHMRHGIMVSFKPKEFERVVPSFIRNIFGYNLHAVSVQLLAVFMGYWAIDNGHKTGFTYFMEKGDKDEAEVMHAVRGIEKSSVLGQHCQIQEFLPISKGSARGLEAADFLAWHWNQYWAKRLTQGRPEDYRKDFQAFVDQIGEGRVASAFLTEEKLLKLVDLQRQNLVKFYDLADFDGPLDELLELLVRASALP